MLLIVVCVYVFALMCFVSRHVSVYWRPAFIWDPVFIRTRGSENWRLLEAGAYLRHTKMVYRLLHRC